jgi:chemotaxis protein MotB
MNDRHRGDDHEEGAGHERWLISYADFITLMFAFFVVLYATSNRDVEKTKEFQESIKRYLIKAGAFGESGQQINQGDKNNTPIEPPIQTFKDSKPETAAALDQAETYLESNLSKDEMKKFVQDIGADDWGVRIIIPSSALYANQSDKFRSEAMPFVEKLSFLLAGTNRKILIEGHVNSGENGNARSTWEFASARAVNLLRFVQKKQSMAGDKLVAASLGDSRPLFTGDSAKAGSADNSRIELVILNQDLVW